MKEIKVLEGKLVAPAGMKVGIVASRFNEIIVNKLLGGAVVGGLWGVFVIFGAHRALLPVGLNDVSVTSAIHNCGAGHNTLMCYAGSANFSQAGAALGVMLKTKSKELKQVAGAATISAFLVGITEPAIYGCNLRLKKPMICAVIAGALGGAIMGIGGASNHGFANNGILTIATYYCSDNTMGMFLAYLNMAILTSISAMTVISRFTAANADAGKNFEMDAISACVVGGVSASGGAGTVLGMVIGATLIGVINLGMFQINLDANYQRVVKGFVLLAAVVFDILSKKRDR